MSYILRILLVFIKMETQIKDIYSELSKKIGKDHLLNDDLSLIAYGADASCYQKTPKLITKPSNEEQVSSLLKILNKNNIPLTFRAAGTSLSGQSISDSVLMQVRGDNWNKVEIIENGKFVKTQPGITGTRLNQLLKPYKVKFGPDPASINSALIGGIIANNASGMSCGTHANSYATIQSAKIIFSDGTLLNTADKVSKNKFHKSNILLVAKIIELRERIIATPSLVAKIKEKYQIKNTTGYGLNSFIDYTDPIDIILHLLVGSEGTLAFISEAIFKTIPDLPYRASAMIYFHSLEDACNAVPLLKNAKVSAIELIDRKALRSIENQTGIPEYIKSFDATATALLIDLESSTNDKLLELIDKTQKALNQFNLVREFEITTQPQQILEYWKIRKGIFPSVGGMRKPGTSIIIEDIAVSLKNLTPAVLDLRKMLDDLNYHDAVIYGHALDGNLHFIFAQDFNEPSDRKRYENMINKLCDLIVNKYNGSLKAEHGTGINMAPFVEYEWGSDLYQVMKEIKQAFDPKNILNPDVIISSDPKLHLKNFKPIPLVDESVDKCIECGFCEINCLSTGYTLSARQRIVIQRELARLKATHQDNVKYKNISKSFVFSGKESCAGDGLCAITCPLSIDTGILIKKLRNQDNQDKVRAQRWAHRIANNFDRTGNIIRRGLNLLTLFHKIFGSKILGFMASTTRWISLNSIPQWHKFLPQGAKFKAPHPQINPEYKNSVVYFPSCINQSMGPSKGDNDQRNLMDVTIDVLERAGYHVILPDNMNTLCCGTPWESKGFIDVANQKSSELETALLKASDNGKHPILCDTSPCIYRMKKVMSKQLNMFEPVEFAHSFLLSKLNLTKIDKKVAIHVTCSSTKMDLQEKFITVAQACVTEAIIPQEVGCCGFAGDKGFTQPKLNDWALRNLKSQVRDCKVGYSNSRTCEIGLSKNTGFDYKSIMYLIDEASK
jgi:D-lactate dehydrogenase